jgi:hypothetical protein
MMEGSLCLIGGEPFLFDDCDRRSLTLEAQRAWIKFGMQTAVFITTPKAAPLRFWPATVVFYRQQLVVQKKQET